MKKRKPKKYIKKEMKDYINNMIIEHYPIMDTQELANMLKIDIGHLRVKAARLGVKRVRVNEIIDGHKLCPRCKETKPIEKFNRDKYQPNCYDYYCRDCRTDLRRIEKEQEEEKNIKEGGKSLAFNKGNYRNAPIIDEDGNEFLVCKACEELLPIDNFSKDRYMSHGHRNTCKKCEALKRRGNI